MKNDPVSGYPLGSPDEPIKDLLRSYGIKAFQQRAGALPEETEAEIYAVKLDVSKIQAPTMQHPLFIWFKWMTGTLPGGKIMEQFQQVLRWRLFAGKEHPVPELLGLGWYARVYAEWMVEKEHGQPISKDRE